MFALFLWSRISIFKVHLLHTLLKSIDDMHFTIQFPATNHEFVCLVAPSKPNFFRFCSAFESYVRIKKISSSSFTFIKNLPSSSNRRYSKALPLEKIYKNLISFNFVQNIWAYVTWLGNALILSTVSHNSSFATSL
jgi:hypothetical protein